MDALCSHLDLLDAMNIATVDTKATRKPHKHYTYWTTRECKSDQPIYIATALSAHVQGESIENPKRQSNHQAVVLTLKEAVRCRVRQQHRFIYRIRSAQSIKEVEHLQQYV